MSSAYIISQQPIKGKSLGARVVEVHLTDGGSAWVLVDSVDLDGLKNAIHARRLLCGRLIGGAGINGRGVLIPADQIQMVIDVDG